MTVAIRSRWCLTSCAWLALLALLPRVLLPAGTMPHFGSGFDIPLALCTSSGLKFRSAPRVPDAPAGGETPQAGHECPFGVLSAGALPGIIAANITFAAAFGGRVPSAVDLALPVAPISAHRARAPPLSYS
jgi:hypothetical protein